MFQTGTLWKDKEGSSLTAVIVAVEGDNVICYETGRAENEGGIYEGNGLLTIHHLGFLEVYEQVK